MAVVNHRDLHLSIRRQRQMCIRDRGSCVPAFNETIVIKSILVTSAGTPSVTVLNNSITAIKSAALTANVTTELLTQPLIIEAVSYTHLTLPTNREV